ncbi:hydroxymethylglutaryl-CoA synthase [Paucilactobacillus vaccinostercus DSM 20634]|uniref:Hydroxymethylglutaryl-CoA synthase n=1 Tax=Paucilactobacillus vaccinostercus DSM 20634 TaxID=1423813 RepID=A0A0R2AF04_9LACO|nr:hydroxymethylglutaryl-CoA synthase [Paucilactobacillus vaccinostercus]KRM62441.1 hydroxymethylglutaryl-CoA synthase [Paucilactobacillus vaccinostercus DSM 20634]
MKIGIDKIGFYTTPLYLDLTELAQARGVDPNKYLIGIGQEKQAVIPPTQDIVTMGANAADRILTDEDRKQISTIIVATESGIDNSKAAAIYVKELLQLDPFVRAVEVKEACYSGTAALQFARGLISLNPDEKVLIIAADIARYGLETSGEVTQGGGAIAMMISAEPRVLAIDGPSVPYSEDVMDFWRPLYASEALVDGKYSTSVYIDFFQKTWERYQTLTDQTLSDMAAMIFHLPFTKMGKKALDAILGDQNDPHSVLMRTQLAASQALSRQVGNLYTGSLYLALLSLLTRSHNLQSGDRIGLFSYGSGAQGEFFTGILQADFKEMVRQADVEKLIMARKQVSVPEYERLFRAQIGYNSKNVFLDLSQDHEKYVLQGQQDQKRVYLIQ